MSRDDLVPCPKCNGSGQIDEIFVVDGHPVPVPMTCDSCGGSGRV